jgi:hypothetical protein
VKCCGKRDQNRHGDGHSVPNGADQRLIQTQQRVVWPAPQQPQRQADQGHNRQQGAKVGLPASDDLAQRQRCRNQGSCDPMLSLRPKQVHGG